MADLSRLSVQSQNLSNIDTFGYKRQIPLTNGFDARLGAAQQPDAFDVNTTVLTDLRAGVLKQTGRTLDLALDGDGFFSIRTPSGTHYTRRGDFRMEATGRLVTADGNAVLAGGGDVVLPSAAVSIDREGQIFDGDRLLAKLDIVRFADPQHLNYVGDAQFESAGATQLTDRSITRVHSGYLETSNVQPAHEMIALMEASRQVEFTRSVLTARDEMLDGAVNTLAQF